MGKLTDKVLEEIEKKYVINAGYLINSVIELKTQHSNTSTTIIALKTKIKSEVSRDVWNVSDIETLGSQLQLINAIKTKALLRKKELTEIQNILTDQSHKNELQAEIDNLNLPV